MARLFEEAEITVNKDSRRYYRLYDTEFVTGMPVIVLISGSGCQDFGARVPSFFEEYPFPLSVYCLEKPHIPKGADGSICTRAFHRTDYLERRVADTLEFLDKEQTLAQLADHTIALLGFSEGGTVAAVTASLTQKIGRLTTAGNGGGMSQSEEFLLLAEKNSIPYTKDALLKEYDMIQRHPKSLERFFWGKPYRYWSSYLFLNPIEIYAKLNIPILTAMGELDNCVPIESGRALQRYFSTQKTSNFTYIEYPEANHRLQSEDKQYIHDFMRMLGRWLRDN